MGPLPDKAFGLWIEGELKQMNTKAVGREKLLEFWKTVDPQKVVDFRDRLLSNPNFEGRLLTQSQLSDPNSYKAWYSKHYSRSPKVQAQLYKSGVSAHSKIASALREEFPTIKKLGLAIGAIFVIADGAAMAEGIADPNPVQLAAFENFLGLYRSAIAGAEDGHDLPPGKWWDIFNALDEYLGLIGTAGTSRNLLRKTLLEQIGAPYDR